MVWGGFHIHLPRDFPPAPRYGKIIGVSRLIMNETTIYFIRHGKIENPKKIYYGRNINLPLSIEGLHEIEAIVRSMRKRRIHIDVIYTSPLSRALATANVLARVFEVPEKNIFQTNDLIDVNIPALAGTPIAQRKYIHMLGFDEYSGKYEAAGNESRESITKRMISAIRKILKTHQGKVIGVVSHGDPLRFLLYRLKSTTKSIPSMGILKEMYYSPKGGGWRMSFDDRGNIVDAKLLPDDVDFTVQY